MATSATNFTINWTPTDTTYSQQVQYRKSGSSSWTTFATVGPSVSTSTITGLADNTVYDFRIVSSCTLGGYTTSNTSPMIRFSCPQVFLTPGDHNIAYSFAHPNADINSISIDLLSAGNIVATQTPAYMNPVMGNFTGLAQGSNYSVRTNLIAGAFTSNCTPYDTVTTTPPPVPSSVSYSHLKSEDPYVDIILVPVVNGQNVGNKYATETGTLSNVFVGDTVTIYLNRAPSSVAWPVGATARLVIKGNGAYLFDSGSVYSATDEITSFTFTLQADVNYEVLTTSAGDTTDYLPVILTQINNSSAPLSTTHPTVVNFRIQDNSNGEMVFDDGTYQQTQINGFNFLDTNGRLADNATLIITNNTGISLRFLVQNYDASTTYWDITVYANSSVTLGTLPKESVRITYVNG